MPTFAYSARPATGGDIQSGEIELPTKDDVLAFLHKQKMIPVSVREKTKQITIKFITQLPTYVPTFVFYCNLPQYIKESYARYLENRLRDHFGFEGVTAASH